MEDSMQTTLLIIFRPDGDAWKTFSNPPQWHVEDGVLYVTVATMSGVPTHTITTTLPFSVEQTM
jgi:hypothetical protein